MDVSRWLADEELMPEACPQCHAVDALTLTVERSWKAVGPEPVTVKEVTEASVYHDACGFRRQVSLPRGREDAEGQ